MRENRFGGIDDEADLPGGFAMPHLVDHQAIVEINFHAFLVGDDFDLDFIARRPRAGVNELILTNEPELDTAAFAIDYGLPTGLPRSAQHHTRSLTANEVHSNGND